jgi:prepilin-type N-terminal cleavage/methylation domain-containing protein
MKPRAFTLVEMLIVVALLGIAGAMVIPAMGSVGVLRIQAAVRNVVSDITFAQADAIAFQQRRAVVFNVPTSVNDVSRTSDNSYHVVQVLGGQINTTTGTLYDPSRPGGRMFQSFGDPSFGGAQIAWANFNNSSTLIFDELGSPAAATTGDTPGTGGTVRIQGPDEFFDIVVEPFTGRVTTRRIPREPAAPTGPSGTVITGGS